MKNIFLIALIFSLISFKAAAVSADDSLIALNKAEQLVTSLPEEGRYQDSDSKNRDKIFDILEKSVKAFKDAPEDQLLLDQIVKVASAMNKKDTEQYSSELVLVLFDYSEPEFKNKSAAIKKRQEQYDTALKKLSPVDAAALKKSIQNFIRSKHQGNG
ncbi:hypothetical protein ACLVWU_13795 [Bdellovibrio sp. HCB290]|uniref:hypothetical protein n=1 Tax=Bdellovibrio sp. HCB290 TaxID=3394356 RepID=UPI0039B5981C